MADLSFSAEIDTRGASRALDGLKNQILAFGSAVAGALAFRELNAVSSRFEDLRTTLGILYKDAQIGAAAFDDIKKFAATSIFSVEDLTETVIKLKAAGLEPTIALLNLFANTSSVAADSVGALQAITDLYARTTAGGLGLEDLNRLADRGIPVFTILSERLGLSRLQIAEVGKTAEGARVILKALEDGLNNAFGSASTARANNVSQAMSNFNDAVANAADALGQAGLNDAIVKLVKGLTDLLNASTPLIEILGKGLGGAITFLAENIKIATAVAAAFLATFAVSRIAAIVGVVLSLTKAMNLFNIVTGKNPLIKLLSIVAGAATAIGIMSMETEDLSGKIDKLDADAGKLGDNNGFKVFKDGKLGAGTEDLRSKVLALNEALNKFKVDMGAVVTEFSRYNEQNIRSLNLETALIGTSRQLQELRRAELDINNRLAEEIARLQQQKAKLTEQERNEGRGAIIDATIAKLEKQAEVDRAATAEAIKNSEARQLARQVELFGIQSRISLEDELMRIQDEMAKSTMSEIEAKYYDIERAANRAALAAIRAEEARIGRPLTTEEQKKYYDEALKGIERVKAATQEQFEQSRRFETGWNRAFRQFADEATNAALQAERIFQRVTKGMEDLIVNFAKTGKFEFRGFINSILEELLRSQIRQIMAQIFSPIGRSGGGSSGNFLGDIGRSLLGFANGGIIPTNAPVVVGERGPEILSGAAGRVVTPNNQIGSTTVVYNINAVDAPSFKQLLAQDPSFLYAVSQQGAKSLPSRR